MRQICEALRSTDAGARCWLDMWDTKDEKVTVFQEDGFVEGFENSALGVRNTRKIKKVTGSQDDEANRSALNQ